MDKKFELRAQINKLQNELHDLEPGAHDPLTEAEIEDMFTGENPTWDIDSEKVEIVRLWNMYVGLHNLIKTLAHKLFVPENMMLNDGVLEGHLEEKLKELDDYKASNYELTVRNQVLEYDTPENLGMSELKERLADAESNLQFAQARILDTMSVNDLARLCYQRACEKGWHDNDEQMSEKELVASYFMNLHSEISEAWEAFRAGKHNQPCDKAEKMKELGFEPLTCFEEEFADIIIRAAEDSVALKIDLWNAIKVKLAYNQSREYRHGNKRA